MNIQQLAKQAGWSELSLSMIQGCEDEKRLERFAALVLEEAEKPQPLSDEQLAEIAMASGAYDEQLMAFARAVEAAHGIKE